MVRMFGMLWMFKGLLGIFNNSNSLGIEIIFFHTAVSTGDKILLEKLWKVDEKLFILVCN